MDSKAKVVQSITLTAQEGLEKESHKDQRMQQETRSRKHDGQSDNPLTM
jgi:hypothetical protein